jgi:hypothetical protein
MIYSVGIMSGVGIMSSVRIRKTMGIIMSSMRIMRYTMGIIMCSMRIMRYTMGIIMCSMRIMCRMRITMICQFYFLIMTTHRMRILLLETLRDIHMSKGMEIFFTMRVLIFLGKDLITMCRAPTLRIV